MFELDPRRLDMVSKGVVQTLPVFREVEPLEYFEPADLMETDDSSLVESYEEFAAGA